MLDESLVQLWEMVLGGVRAKLNGPGFQTFVSSTKMLSYTHGILTLQVSNGFSKDWIKQNCELLIKEILAETHYPVAMISYVVDPIVIEEAVVQPGLFERPRMREHTQNFNDKYTFENFIVGHNNRFAYAASEAVSKAPAKAYNPLFIYGSVGLGKTHLLHAIGLRIKETYTQANIVFVSSEKFTNDLINAIKDKRVEQFREKYRQADVLLVDDIQFLAGKEQTQEEFFHTFNELHSNNKQIILTSDRSPKEIPTLEIRLRTRFEWGLIADIQPPGLETRIAILRKKIEINGFNISDDILHFIASQIPSNVREMEGCLTRIVAYASLLNTEVTLSIASNVIRDVIGIRHEKPLSISHIKRKVGDYFNVSEQELCSKNRAKDLTYARQIAMYLARELTNVSLPKIGENFGGRDHSTVMHACDKIKTLGNTDPETQSIINLLITNIRSDS